MQIIVLGMHRSGTSAVAGALHLMGAYVGAPDALMSPQPDNPRGFWERSDVAGLNDRLLASADASWWNIAGFNASRLPEQAVEAFDVDAAKILTDLESHRPWVAKDPRFCLLLPLWLRLLDRPVCVMVHRDPVEIALSLKERNGFSLTQGVALWEHYIRSALRSARHDQLLLLSYQDLIDDAEATTLDLHRRLQRSGVDGLAPADRHELAAFVDPDLQHHRDIQFDSESLLNDAQSRLARALGDGIVPSASDGFNVSVGAGEAAAELAARESVENDARDHIADLERRLQESSQSSTLLAEELERTRAAEAAERDKGENEARAHISDLEQRLTKASAWTDQLSGELATIKTEASRSTDHAIRLERELEDERNHVGELEKALAKGRQELDHRAAHIRQIEEDLVASNRLRADLEDELSQAVDHQRKLEAELSTLEDQIAEGATYARHVEDELNTTRDSADRAAEDAHRTREAMTRLETGIRALESRPLVRVSLWLQKVFGASE